MNSANNGRWIIPLKKFSRLRVNGITIKSLCRLKRRHIGITFVGGGGGGGGSVVVGVQISLYGAELCHCRSKSFQTLNACFFAVSGDTSVSMKQNF